MLEGWGRRFRIKALNERGKVLVPPIATCLRACPALLSLTESDGGDALDGTVKEAEASFTEEERSRQNSIFSVVRALTALFAYEDEPQLGLYGAFGYDLTFQFEDVKRHQKRDPNQRDLVLYLPDEILVIDILSNAAWKLQYDFTVAQRRRRRRTACRARARRSRTCPRPRPDPAPPRPRRGRLRQEGRPRQGGVQGGQPLRVGPLADVLRAVPAPAVGGVPPAAQDQPVAVRLPHLSGTREYLVGASPEMFVRVEKNAKGWRCETCPISGTIRRGANALEDAENIKTILADKKEESELTMCTDVDRNDKSRICKAGCVQVIGRRQIEMYSRLIHTVDHVEGYLREGFDAMDAFLCHTWAVTVTGAPKTWAIQFVENQEESPRCWYGGAVGMLGFDGHLNTGLTLRTVRIANGVAEVRAGATLLFDSDPASRRRRPSSRPRPCATPSSRPASRRPLPRASNAPSAGGARARWPARTARAWSSWTTRTRSCTHLPTTCGRPARSSPPSATASTKRCSTRFSRRCCSFRLGRATRATLACRGRSRLGCGARSPCAASASACRASSSTMAASSASCRTPCTASRRPSRREHHHESGRWPPDGGERGDQAPLLSAAAQEADAVGKRRWWWS